MGNFEVVVARYKENLDWLVKEFPNDKVTIYNKGKPLKGSFPSNYDIVNLPNYGREAYTYLYHIVHQYGSLSQTVLFLQGNPYDYSHLIFQPLSVYKEKEPNSCLNVVAPCTSFELWELNGHLIHTPWAQTKWNDVEQDGRTIVSYVAEFIKPINRDQIISIIYNSQFAVSVDVIHRHNISYYNKMLSSLESQHPIAVHYLERLWDVVFDDNYY